MRDVLEKLERQVAAGPQQAPVRPTEAVEAAEESAYGRLLVALTDDEALHAEWGRSAVFDQLDAPGRLAWVQADLEEVDERIDAGLDSDERDEMIELLARSGIGWRHEALVEALEAEGPTRRAAARVVARSTPDKLRSVLIGCEVVDEVIEFLRAAALEGAGDLWDQFLLWRERVAAFGEIDEETRESYLARIDGAGACLEPTLFARGLLAGDYGLSWLDEPESVADFLQVYGPTDWLEVLGVLEAAKRPSAGRLAATLAVAAAAGLESEPPGEEEAENLLELLAEQPTEKDKEAGWEALASRLGFGFQIAMGEDEFGLLLAQVAAHERLVTHGIHSPGIPGLPMSATTDEHLEASKVNEVLGEMIAGDWTDEQEVRAVRTLCDGRVWQRRDDDQDAIVRALGSMFEQVSLEAVETARAQLMASLDEARLEWEREAFDESPDLTGALVLGAVDEQARSEQMIELLAERAAGAETPLGMDCLRYLGRMPSEGVLERLGALWGGLAPTMRATFARRVLEEAVAVGVARRED